MFLLFLMGLGAASVKAQVRIGGNTPPSAAAVLDLNATDATNNGTGGFTLPRVSLASNTAQLNNTTPITGMLVYNTNATLGVGIYFWNGTNWLPISGDDVIGNEVTNATAGGGLTRAGSGTTTSPYTLGIATGGVTKAMLAAGAAFDGDSIVGNEVTNATSGGGLVRAGSGTTASPYTLGIATNGITSGMIANGAVTLNKISTSAADSGKFLVSNGTAWLTSTAALAANTFYSDSVQRWSATRPVSWTYALDSTLYVDIPPGRFARIKAPTITTTELCWTTPYSYIQASISDITSHEIFLWNALNASRITGHIRVICVRTG